MILFITVTAGLLICVAAYRAYLRGVEKKVDLAETSQLMKLTPEELRQALNESERDCERAHASSRLMYREWRDHTLGFCHNPDFLGYVVAEADYARLYRRLVKLQQLVLEI